MNLLDGDKLLRELMKLDGYKLISELEAEVVEAYDRIGIAGNSSERDYLFYKSVIFTEVVDKLKSGDYTIDKEGE